ncbi:MULTISPECIES: hypothetical protein [unclassified Frankia]|uniref:hypothetical protein n=1 Tax=unclassified Frankia TaxID=2632575 RepID=UPI0020252030
MPPGTLRPACPGAGLAITAVVAGGSGPDSFSPEPLAPHRAGKLPAGKLITTVPSTQINEAAAPRHRGEAVKIVLVHE